MYIQRQLVPRLVVLLNLILRSGEAQAAREHQRTLAAVAAAAAASGRPAAAVPAHCMACGSDCAANAEWLGAGGAAAAPMQSQGGRPLPWAPASIADCGSIVSSAPPCRWAAPASPERPAWARRLAWRAALPWLQWFSSSQQGSAAAQHAQVACALEPAWRGGARPAASLEPCSTFVGYQFHAAALQAAQPAVSRHSAPTCRRC